MNIWKLSEHICSFQIDFVNLYMENYANLIDAIAGLRLQGYTLDFNLKQNCLTCLVGNYTLLHDEFHIDKSFRFDANTDPDDESILYAISSEKYNIKGILVNGYGTSAEPHTNEMVEKLK